MAVTLNANTSTGFIATSDTSGVLQLQTGGTTAVTVDASANVGIGTASPNRKFVVSNAGAQGFEFGAGVGAGSGNEVLNYNRSTSLYIPSSAYASTHTFYAGTAGGTRAVDIDSSGNVGIGLASTGDTLLEIYGANSATTYKNVNTGTGSSDGFYVGMAKSSGTDGYVYNRESANVIFGTANAERARIDSSGNLLVGATSTAFPSSDAKTVSLTNSVQTAFFANVNAASSTGTAGIVIRKYDNNNTTSQIYLHCNYNQGTSGAGGIQGNGASGVQFYSSSDARLKENIIELEPQLANILALKPSKFDFIDGPKDCTGFIAQEMETVYPDAIGEGEDGYKTIGGISIMETRLIKAIQELKALVDTQASTITSLTDRITALEGTTP